MATTAPLPHTGFGLLGFTWRNTSVPDELAFPAMKAAIANGATVWSSSDVYGKPPDKPTAGISLLRRYFEAYPEDAPKVTLFIRGCFDASTFTPRCTRAEVRASWAECARILGGFKAIDVFGPARMDQPNVPLEETIGALKELRDEGKIGAVGLSEVRAETIRRAAAIVPIRFVEIEFSLWMTEMLDNGVALAAKECDVVIMAYAPLGYGFLTGQVKSLDDIPAGDVRHLLGRFQPETFSKNLDLVHKLEAVAARKGVTPAQLALAWVRSYSNTGDCGAIMPIPGATHVDRVKENCAEVSISSQEREELDTILRSFEVVGDRKIPGNERFVWT